jgi:hypothetical protein
MHRVLRAYKNGSTDVMLPFLYVGKRLVFFRVTFLEFFNTACSIDKH